MKIHLISIGTKMPKWVETGYQEYAKRMPAECSLQLREVNGVKKGKNYPVEQIVETEGKALLNKVPNGSYIVALDVKGKAWSTEALAQRLAVWLGQGQDLSLLVGGPDGLSAGCRAKSQEQWSLSALTLPHPLVRVVLAEALYRAWTILQNHPYHRAG